MGDLVFGVTRRSVATPWEEGRRPLWEATNGLVGPHSSAAGFQPRGGRESMGGHDRRGTSLQSTGSRRWLYVGRRTRVCFLRPGWP